VQPIYEEGEKFLGVMLSVAREHRIDGTDCTLYAIGHKDVVRLAPHASDEFSITFCEFALSAQDISAIDFVLKAALQEVLC
jgi:hypothetical protein